MHRSEDDQILEDVTSVPQGIMLLSPPSPHSNRSSTPVNTVQNELDGTEDVPCRFCSHHICDLPPEVLCAIFRAYAPYESAHSISLRQNLLRICRYFRVIALADPSLWSDIDLMFPIRVAWFLAHSGSGPIRLYIDTTGPDKYQHIRQKKQGLGYND
jgi:hypothetical protein